MAEVQRHVLVIHSAGDLAYLERLRPSGFRFTLIKKCPTDEDRRRFDAVIDFDYQQGTQETLSLIDSVHNDRCLDGVVTFSESGVIMAAIAAAHLGRPGNPTSAAVRARNKFLMRQALLDAGMDCPAFVLVRDAQEALAQVSSRDQPMVLKPISGSSSYGVTRLQPGDSAADIDAHMRDVRRYITEYGANNPQYPFEFWLPDAGHGVAAEDVYDPQEVFLLEGFLGGRQVSVDGFVCAGRVVTCGVIDIERIKDSAYFLEYEEWMPARRPAAETQAIEDTVCRAVQAIGLRNGPFHCELKVTDDAIHIIEVAARRGADNIGDFLQQVYGIDIYEEAVRIACGEDRHRAHPVPRQHMKMRYFLPQSAGRLVAIHGLDAVRRDPRVSELIVDFQPGDEILVPPAGFEFLGYVSVSGATPEAADAALDEVYDKVSFAIAGEAQPPLAGVPGAPVEGKLLVVQPSADYAFRVRCHVPGAVFLVTPDRAAEMADYPIIVADLDDLEATRTAVHTWSVTGGDVDGITCFVCERLELTAHLAAELQVPFHPLEAVHRSRHKELATATWQAAGVPVPASQSVGGLPDILDFAQHVAPPWILKPTDRSGSAWVLRVDRQQDLLPAHLCIGDGLTGDDLTGKDRRQRSGEPRYLAQELVQGRELSADLYLHDGQLVDVLRCTEKWLVDMPGLAGLVGAYYPAQIDPAQMAVLRSTFARAAVALGVSDGIVMVDGILRDGVMYVLEMGLRPGGDCLPELCRLSSGYDPIRSACQAALGQRPDGGHQDDPNVAAVHLMANCEGTIASLSLDRVRTHPAVVNVDSYRGCGDRLRVWAGSYDDRIVAACLVRFKEVTELAALTQQLLELVDLEVLPEGAPTTPPVLEAA